MTGNLRSMELTALLVSDKFKHTHKVVVVEGNRTIVTFTGRKDEPKSAEDLVKAMACVIEGHQMTFDYNKLTENSERYLIGFACWTCGAKPTQILPQPIFKPFFVEKV